MLCAIQHSSNQKVLARAVAKAEGPFHCPKCRRELNIRKGPVKIHHFAHKPPITCSYGAGESEAHRRAKESIYEALQRTSGVTTVELEKDWGAVVSDVYAEIKGHRVAFEVQISNLTMTEILDRTRAYAALGIAVLWLPLFDPKLNKPKYSPRGWEKWLHATYFGRVYYWMEGLTVIPVRFADYELEVPESTWYDQSGDEQSAGGFTRRSKRWRKPVIYPPATVPTDFVLRTRPPWKGGKFVVPACRILIDKVSAERRSKKKGAATGANACP